MATPDPPVGDEAQLSEHEEQSVDAIAAFHREHYGSATPLQRTLDAVTDTLGRPMLVIVLILGVAGWIAVTQVTGHGGVTEPSFAWLELTATVASLLIAILILATQRREDDLADRRAKLTLELAILADRKNAKIIALLEELRRDAPNMVDRVDPESADMAKPTDPGAVLAAIDERARPEKATSPR
jgi:uncharacterized membrane protein